MMRRAALIAAAFLTAATTSAQSPAPPLSHASAKQAAALTNERDTLSAQLELTKTLQTSVQDIVRFASTSAAAASGAGTLAAQIAALERTVPEARHTVSPSAARGAAATQPAAAATPASTAAAADAPAFQPESAGIVALATELVGTAATSRSLSNLVKQTDAVTQSIESTRAPLVADLRVLIRNVDATSSAPAAPLDPHAVQSAVARVKQISTALVPLAEQGVAVEHARAALVSARTTVSEHMALAGRYVLMRILALAVSIAALLIVSEFWRRATFRYLHDPHRRRQFLLLRRIVVAGAVVAILVIAFVSQIGSLATYAGFVTAGLAVALQNVLLAVIAYFLLIGRYGVHVGDRVTIGGVTGSVIEIGLIRMYLMELAAPDWHPTGRIVVFSKPAFEPFRESLQRQYAAMQEQVDMTTPVPGPHVQIHLADQGVDVLVRYPVEPKRANEMDNRMLTAVRDALAAAPSVPLAPSGAPALDDAKDHAG